MNESDWQVADCSLDWLNIGVDVMTKYILTGLTHPVVYELEQGLNTVGRNPTNELRIRDATVSSFHCELILNQDGVVARDLGSSNGTFIDDRRVEEGFVAAGSVLRLGSFELRLESRQEADPVRVAVPPLPVEPVIVQPLMPDGYPACLHHPSAYAGFRCEKCEKTFCPDCVRVLQLAETKMRVFCPSCSGLCAPLPIPPGVVTSLPKKRLSLIGRLSQTIRIRPRPPNLTPGD